MTEDRGVLNSREAILGGAKRDSKVFDIEGLGPVRIAEFTHGQKRDYFKRMVELNMLEDGTLRPDKILPIELVVSFCVVGENLAPVLDEKDVDGLPADVVNALFYDGACEMNDFGDDVRRPRTEEEIDALEDARAKAMFEAAFGPATPPLEQPATEEAPGNG